MRPIDLTSVAALVFSLAILAVGYAAFGAWTTVIFASGFLGGFVCWMIIPSRGGWADIRAPFFLALALFILHRVEEKVMGFFAALQEITGVPTPEIVSWPVLLLLLTSVGAWLVLPILVARGAAFGHYVAWTFFASMGVTELAHFVLPLALRDPYGYFPGMASVVFLAPAGWWGMSRLARGRRARLASGLARSHSRITAR